MKAPDQRFLHLVVASLSIIGIAGLSSTQAQEGDHFTYWEEVAMADREFSRAATERGRTEAFLEVLGENSVMFREGPVDARELYRRNQSQYSLDQLSWRDHFIDVSRAGDLGVTVGPNIFTGSVPNQGEDQRQQTYSYLMNVWEKIDGQWKLMALNLANVPGYLSMDVMADYEDTLAMMAETASPEMIQAETLAILAETASPEMIQENTMESLVEADNRFGLNINFRGGQRTIMSYGLENVRVYLPNMAPAVGMESAGLAYGKYLDSRVTTTNPVQVDTRGGNLARSREMGYTYGVMSTSNEGANSGFRVNYLRIWRFHHSYETGENEWKMAMEILRPF